MSFKIKGFDEFSGNINELQQNAKELESNRSVPLEEVFTEAFMKTYTPSGSIECFFKDGGFEVETDADFEDIPREALDRYVAEQTSFHSFQEMTDKAVGEYIIRKLGF